MGKMYKLTGEKAAVLNKYFVNADYKRDTEVKESGLISKFYSDFDGEFKERLKKLASGGVFTDKNISTLKNIFNKLDIKNKPSDTDWDEIANTNKEAIAKKEVIRKLSSDDRGDLRKIFEIEVVFQNENTKELTYIKTDSDLKKTIEEYNLELLKSNMSECCKGYSKVTFKKIVKRIIKFCHKLGIEEDKNPMKKIIGYTSMDIEPKAYAFFDSHSSTQDPNATPVNSTTSDIMHITTEEVSRVLNQYGLSAEPNPDELFPQLAQPNPHELFPQLAQLSYISGSNLMEREILTGDGKRKRSPSVSSTTSSVSSENGYASTSTEPPFKQQKINSKP